MQFLSLRAVFLLGFVVAMPVMALPAVARRIDELLYGPPKTGVEQSLDSRPPPTQSLRSASAEYVSTATYQEPTYQERTYQEQSPAAMAPMAEIEGGAQ